MEISEFFTSSTLEAIDWGVLDLTKFDVDAISTLYFFEALLTCELRDNYRKNGCGIFRVRRDGDLWVYTDRILEVEIVSDSILELKREVIDANHIWYVFDAELAREAIL